MSVMIFLIFISLCRSQEILVKENIDLNVCIGNIVMHNFRNVSEITYIDMNYSDNGIIKYLHNMKTVTLVSRTTGTRINHYNEAYFIMVDNFNTLSDQLDDLTKEKYWNPKVYFLIVLQEIDTNSLIDFFKILLHHHVLEVIVIDSNNLQLFAYNPYDNYNCGKSYTNILNLGNCATMDVSNIYFYKFPTGLERCTFSATVPHWPPYIINPDNNLGPVKLLGTEQYVMKILSELEGFNINYTYRDNGEEFSTIGNDMEATGLLGLIQKQNSDIIFGGMMLTYDRVEAFGYLCGHHVLNDKLNIVVKKTGPVPMWKNLYLEFAYIVWILFGLTFLTFSIVLVLLFNANDKGRIVLLLWAILLQQSCRLNFKLKVKFLILQWVLFSCLINIYYQSNLMGLTTHVSCDYQVSNEKDLLDYNLQSCVSPGIKELVRISTGKHFNVSGENCDSILNSLHTVSEDNTKYTVTLYSIYKYNKLKFTDDTGDPLLSVFKIPIYKVMYAVYFYKGFPLLQKMHTHMLRLDESGLIKNKMDDLFYENARRTFFDKKQFQARFIFPHGILVIGIGLSATSFVIELIVDYVQRRRMSRIMFLH